MILYEPGSVLLVRFPFTDLTATKKRPVVVVSSQEYQAGFGDVLVMALTSSPQESTLLLEDWREAGLVRPTWVKPLLATLSPEVVHKRLGNLSTRDFQRAGAALRTILAWELLFP